MPGCKYLKLYNMKVISLYKLVDNIGGNKATSVFKGHFNIDQ